MKLKTIIILCIPLIYSCNTKTEEINCSALNKIGIEHYIDSVLYSGNCLIYNGKTISESRKIKKGLHKNTIGYWDTGEVKYTGGMKNDSLNGIFKEFYRSGKIAIKGKFNMGFYDGKWKYSREDGTLQRITIFKKGKVVSETNKD